MGYILRTDRITKKFKNCLAVDRVSVNVEEGDIYGFIGKNGAGKTTFLKVICGLIHPTSGEMDVPEHISALIESPGYYGNMTALQNVELKMLYAGQEDKEAAREVINLVGLDPDSTKKAGDFSLGMKQRLGIAMALIDNPKFMVLDEPINGLDPQGIVEIRDIINKLNKERGITFIIASHILEELSKIATRYGIIHEGQLILELSAQELNDRLSERIVINVDDNIKAYNVLLQNGYKTVKIDHYNNVYVYGMEVDSSKLVKILVQAELSVYTVNKIRESLEDFYLSVTRNSIRRG